jgi:hypothetical protein
VGDLTFAEAGFTTSLGKFQASWSLASTKGVQYLRVSWTVPANTIGVVTLPGIPGETVKELSGSARRLQIQESMTVYGENLVAFEIKGSDSVSVKYEGP